MRLKPFPSGCSIYTDSLASFCAVSPRTRKLGYKNQDVEVAVASLIIIISDSLMEFVFPIPETVDSVRSEVLIPGVGQIQGSTQLKVVTNILESLWVPHAIGQTGKNIELMYLLGNEF